MVEFMIHLRSASRHMRHFTRREILKKIVNILKKEMVMRKDGMKGISRKKRGHRRIKNKHWEQRKNEKREEIHQNNKNKGGTLPSYSSLNEMEKLK